MPALRVAVIGLGQVGSRFDEQPGRQTVWSHVGAYLGLPDRYVLVGAADPDPANQAAFAARCPGVPCFPDAAALFGAVQPEIVSICVPTALHHDVAQQALDRPGLRALWCEKPITDNLATARALLDKAESRSVPVIVSYVRRWLPLWRTASERLQGGEIGRLRSVRVAMPNRLWSIGSHAVDLLGFFGGRVTATRVLPQPELAEGGEPAASALLRFESGAAGILQTTGMKAELLVEAELIGSEGRIAIDENRGTLSLSRFAPSERYAGYRELETPAIETPGGFAAFSPFLAIATELHDVATTGRRPTCSGRDAWQTQSILEIIAQACAANGVAQA